MWRMIRRNDVMPNVLGVPMHGGSLEDAVDRVISLCGSARHKGNHLVSTTSAHGLVIARRKPAFREILKNDFSLNLPAGRPVVLIGRWLKGAAGMQQCRGSDFLRAVIERSDNKPIKHFFCGGKKPGIANKLKEVCEKRYGNRFGSRWFDKMPDEELRVLAQEINSSGADIVWIGLSTPTQEEFAARLAQFTTVGVLVTVGAAAFDFALGRVKEAPGWLQRHCLEWFHCLCMEPCLYRRYGKVVPLFILYNLIDILYNLIDLIDRS